MQNHHLRASPPLQFLHMPRTVTVAPLHPRRRRATVYTGLGGALGCQWDTCPHPTAWATGAARVLPLYPEHQRGEGEDPDAVDVLRVPVEGPAHHRDEEVQEQHLGQDHPDDVRRQDQLPRLHPGQIRDILTKPIAQGQPQEV